MFLICRHVVLSSTEVQRDGDIYHTNSGFVIGRSQGSIRGRIPFVGWAAVVGGRHSDAFISKAIAGQEQKLLMPE